MANEENVIVDADSALRTDNIVSQIDNVYPLTFPISYKGVLYTGFRLWPSNELTGKVQEMIFDSAYLRTKAWETSRAILSRVVKEFVTEDGDVQVVAPSPQGSLAHSKSVPRYATAEKLVNHLSEPDVNLATFVYQRDFIDDEIAGKYKCRGCGEEFTMEDDLNDYRVASPKEAILRFLMGIEGGCTIAEMQDLVKDEDLDALWGERFPEGEAFPAFTFTVKKGFISQGAACKELKLKVLLLHESVNLAKRILSSDKDKPMAATHARLNSMLVNVPGAEESLALSRGNVVKGFGAADYGKLTPILSNAFERVSTARNRSCPSCGFNNKNMQLDMMNFFGMGSSE